MNLFSSVRNLIIGLIAITAIFQAAYMTFYVFDNERERIRKSVYSDVKNLSLNLQGSIEFLMSNDHLDQVKVKITELGVLQKIRYAMLMDKKNNVFASTKVKHVGGSIWNVLDGFSENDIKKIKEVVNSESLRPEGEIWTSSNKDVVVSVLPVAAFKNEKTLRMKKEGTLILVHELGHAVDETFGFVLRMIMFQIIGLFVLGLLLHLLVFRRLSVIRKQTRQITSGNYNVAIRVKGNDELSLLARDIESMAIQVGIGLQELHDQKIHIRELLDAAMRSEETFKSAQEIAHIGSWDWDISGGGLSWSDEIYRIFGLKPQEFGATYDAFLKSVHPDDQQLVIDGVNSAVADADVRYQVEHRVVHPGGEVREVQEQGKVYRDKNGDPVRMIGTVVDITERKLIEQALASERNFISAVLASAGALVLVLDCQGKIVRFNHACEELSGYSFDEIKGRYPWDTVLDKNESDIIYSEVFKTLIENPGQGTSSYTNYWLNKEGDKFLIDWANSVLLDESGKVEYVVSTGIDITEKHKANKELEKYRENLENIVDVRTKELKDAQDELIRKERLATLGQLTATVSHELRNPLGAMAPSLYIVKKISDVNDERLQQAISRIERNITRCDRIIDELLDFTRIDKVKIEPVVIDSWLSAVINEQRLPDGISMNNNFLLGSELVMIDVDVMRRAVINVYDNACQAMLDESSNKVIANAVVTISTSKEAEKILIKFRDTGCGMSEEVLARIYEPLYSTKGFGVGLGMPTVNQIMQQHNGGVDIESNVNIGTTVTLWLPVIKQDG